MNILAMVVALLLSRTALFPGDLRGGNLIFEVSTNGNWGLYLLTAALWTFDAAVAILYYGMKFHVKGALFRLVKPSTTSSHPPLLHLQKSASNDL